MPDARFHLGNRQQAPEEPEPGIRVVAYPLGDGQHGCLKCVSEPVVIGGVVLGYVHAIDYNGCWRPPRC